MTEPFLFPTQLRLSLMNEANILRDRLHEVSARLGTTVERSDDFDVARSTARRLKDVQMALVGIAVLERPPRVRRTLPPWARRGIRRARGARVVSGGPTPPLAVAETPTRTVSL
jgi:hypothetical protein